jgi:hypothetical protein
VLDFTFLSFFFSFSLLMLNCTKALVKLDRKAEAKACRSVAMSYLKPNDPEAWEVGSMLGLNDGVAPPQPEDEGDAAGEASPEKGKEEMEPAAAPEPTPAHPVPPKVRDALAR